MAHCIFKGSKEFKQLQADTNLHEDILSAKIELWQKSKIDSLPQLKEAIESNIINESEITYTDEEGNLCAEMGLTNTTKGTSWKIVKDFKGMPKHSQGGVDISISDKGVSMRRGGKDIKAAHGLVIPATIIAQDGLVVDGEDDDILPNWDKVKATLNPKNWGVTDYTDKYNTWDEAYAAAKKAGEKEIMWNKGKNPGRKNLDYAGTPRQEVGAYGVDGKPVHPLDLDYPVQINKYDLLNKNYLPGHISAQLTDYLAENPSVDYSSRGNYPLGIDTKKDDGKKTYNVYGDIDKEKFEDKAFSLPTGNHSLSLGLNEQPSDWNLFTNNCADNVCDAFGIPRSRGIETPANTLDKIKNKYPTLEVTGRTIDDYRQLGVSLRPMSFYKPDEVLKQSKNLIGILSSPDLKNTEASEKITFALQNALSKKGYKLPKSTTKDGTFDGILGDETKQALLDYQTKNKKK